MNRFEKEFKILNLNMSFQCLQKKFQEIQCLHEQLVFPYIEKEDKQTMMQKHCEQEIERLKRSKGENSVVKRKTSHQEEKELLLNEATQKAIENLQMAIENRKTK